MQDTTACHDMEEKLMNSGTFDTEGVPPIRIPQSEFPISSPLEAHEHKLTKTAPFQGRYQSFARAHFDPFAGSNQKGVFEDIGELEAEVKQSYDGNWDSIQSMKGWVFQEVNFSAYESDFFLSLPLQGAIFWGCKFPDKVNEDDVRRKGATYVVSNPDFLPFKPLRAFLYTPKELSEKDSAIYKYYKETSSISARMAYALHDFSMLDAILDYAEGKTFVGVMGGHQVKRTDPMYEQLVRLGNLIANLGFICVTGGGPGAMEATNLGAYLSSMEAARRKVSLTAEIDEQPSESSDDVFEYRGDEHGIDEALALIRKPVDGFIGEEMHNVEAARRVTARFGEPVGCSPSIGIPTWFYGHEPSNIFASYHVMLIF